MATRTKVAAYGYVYFVQQDRSLSVSRLLGCNEGRVAYRMMSIKQGIVKKELQKMALFQYNSLDRQTDR